MTQTTDAALVERIAGYYRVETMRQACDNIRARNAAKGHDDHEGGYILATNDGLYVMAAIQENT